ncbi:CUB and sushi domain-containing protein 3-like [Branchiostoma floridae x Branchiostoma belcheri]
MISRVCPARRHIHLDLSPFPLEEVELRNREIEDRASSEGIRPQILPSSGGKMARDRKHLSLLLSIFLTVHFKTVVSQTTPSTTDQCEQQVDIVFLIDSSESVRSGGFETSKEFVISVAENFDFAQDATRIGVVTFSNSGLQVTEVRLNEFDNRDDFVAAVRAIDYDRGGTYTGEALDYVRTNSFIQSNGARDDVLPILVVLTDDDPADDVAAPAQRLRQQGVTVFAVGVGHVLDITDQTLLDIAGDQDRVLRVEDFRDLADAIHAQRLGQSICDSSNLCDPSPCHAMAMCTVLGRTFQCACVLGFVGDGLACQVVTCPTLVAPENGSLDPSGANTYQDVVQFACKQGFRLVGDTAATCQATGTWSHPVPRCEALPCPTLTAPTNGALSPAGANSYQDVVTFTCNQGYGLDGATSVTCQADQTWTAPIPTCQPLPCPALTAPVNGALSPTGANSYQDVVTFTCDQGYGLNGASSVTCQADQTWSAPVPTCRPLLCPTLTAPVNGALSPTGANSYQDVVTFTCDQGYRLDGASSTTCQADQTWRQPVPTCQPLPCPTLTAPTNGALSPAGANSYQDVVTFTCDQGYGLNGASSVTCQADQTWSAPVPTCQQLLCPTLTAPVNGALSPAGANSYQDVVTFTCDQGYGLNGASSVTCQADQTWSAPVPACRPLPCPTLTAPTNGALSPAGANSYQDVVTFTCDQGYGLNGASSVTCQADQTWSAPIPTCQPRQCQTLTDPVNGALSPTGANSYQDVVTFTCDQGYGLNGASRVTCQADQTWSAPVPTCQPLPCSTLTAPVNGALSPAGANSYQDVVTFTCNQGYGLNGASSVTCQADQTWSAPIPTCQPLPCPTLTAPVNGALSPAAANSYQDVVTFTCDQGYGLNGASSVTCQADQTWSAPVPTCQPRQCPTLTAPANGALSPAGANSYQDVVTFTCDQGYGLNGASSVTCQADQTWSAPVPTCQPRQCPTLTAPANGALSPTGANSYQDVVTFTCDQGYGLNGASSVTCQADQTWSAPIPTCQPRQCQTLTDPVNGALNPTGANSYQDVVTFTCDQGYGLNGASRVTCQADQTWSAPVPTCQPLPCPTLTAPVNGALSPAGANSYQDVVTFTCDQGYGLNGASSVTCQADQTWSAPVPTCQPLPCPTLTAPVNGALSPAAANSYQDVVTFTCDQGYGLNGASSVTCQADQTWSAPVPTCQLRQCPTLTAPANGALSPAGANSYQDVVTFTCDQGYGLNGASSVTCQADQTWSAPVPTCQPRQCPTLTAPANGALSPTGANSYQDVVTFTCDQGYGLDGASSTTCQVDQTWSEPVPTCRPLPCPTLTAPTNGALSPAGANSYQDVVTFTCNQGYRLDGASSVTCQSDQTWSEPVPTCRALPCPTLTAPVNGALSPVGANSYQDVVTFTCNQGYGLNGASSVTCQADQTWSAPVPTCQPGQCPSLTAPVNGALTPAGANSYQDVVTFTCNQGYELDGASSVTCQVDQTWSAPIPTCQPRECPTLSQLPNGALNPAGANSYQDVVTFTCDQGYGLDGASSTTCQVDQTWSQPVPTCRPLPCPTLTVPVNGALSPAGANSYQDVVTFTCDQGYGLNGASSVTCQADQTWSAPVPTCQPGQCPTLRAPTNGALSPEGATSYRDVVTFTCDQGYGIDGATSTTCQADRTWSEPVPTCRALPCPALTAPVNGALSPAGANSYQDVVTFTCNQGYGLNGAASVTCQADQTWGAPIPTCQPGQCPTLTAPVNGALSPAGANSYQDVVTFTCTQGYELDGASRVTCQADQTWSEPIPTCRALPCPTLTAPANGALSPTGANSYQDVVTFTCDQGYGLNGASSVTCQVDQTWSAPVPGCQPQECPTLTPIPNGALSPTGANSYQDVVTFTCDQGYRLDGASSTTCQVDQTWSEPVPTCRPLPCPTLTAPVNGALSPVGANSYQDVVTFTCDQGYGLNGASSVTCQADQTWSAPVPTCQPGRCPTLTAPVNGALSPAGANSYQDVVTFTCDQGYELDGASRTTCQANQAWSEPVPNCQAQECPTLTAPVNGALSPVGANSYQDVVTFTCDQGYGLNGASGVTCQADQTWSAPVPTCRGLTCPTLTAPVNGALSPTGANSYQDVVTFTCDQGYGLNGASSVTCQADQTWSAPVPTCQTRQCPTLTQLSNGALSPTGANSYQDVVTFTCNQGYRLDGASSATCQQDQTWSEPVPTCRALQCSALSAPVNGALSPSGANSYQDVVTFTCDQGYVLDGASRVTCQADQTWSGTIPTCRPGQCPTLTAPINGALSPTGANSYQDVVTFTCNQGYGLNGASSVTCQADQTWSAPVPTCQPRQCPRLASLPNGALSPVGANSYQDVVTFTCNQGYRLDGASRTTCQLDLTWSEPVPTCRALPCPTLTAPVNGALSPTGANSYQDVVTFTCNQGYRLEGTSSLRCQADQTWSGSVPNCQRGQCPTLSPPSNGALSPAGANSYQDVVTFTCNQGYNLNGASSVTCQADQRWSEPVPTCQPRRCSTLTQLANGALNPAGAISYQDVVTFTCNQGYRLDGASSTICQLDQTWSEPVPTCRALPCPTLTAPVNGALSPTGANSYQDVVTFTCNQGYRLSGASRLTCQADQTWSGPIPTCQRRQCSALAAPVNGALSPVGANSYQDVVTFTCNQGYGLNGASSVTCQADQTWSAPVPTCQPVQCPSLIAPAFGTLRPIGANSYQDVVHFTCNEEYQLDGASSTTCQADRTWSEPVPDCREEPCDRLDREGWDLVFLLDSSGSVDQSFLDAKSFTRETIAGLIDSDGVTHIGLVQYNENQQTAFNLNQYQTKADILSAVDNINYLGGGTYTGRAIHFARQVSFGADSGNRANRPDALVVLTDGVSFDPVAYAAQSARHQGITVFAIGMGTTVDRDTLDQIAGNPQNVLQVSDPGSRAQVIKSLKRWLCRAAYCGDPGAPTDGIRQGTFYQGGQVDFSCHDGYTLVGETSITCQWSTWSSDVPVCRVGGPCSPNPCQNGGQCFQTVNSYRCQCSNGYWGPTCAFRPTIPVTRPAGFTTRVRIRDRLNHGGWDLILLLDSSTSLGQSNFEKVKQYAKDIVDGLPLSTEATRIGLVQYSDTPSDVVFLKDYENKMKISEAIDDLSYLGGATFTGEAIDHTRTISFAPSNGNREGVPDALVVLTDGKSSDDISFPSLSTRQKGVNVFVIGVGEDLDRETLQGIAGDPEKVLPVPDDDALPGANTKLVNWLNRAVECRDPGMPLNGIRRGSFFQGGQVDYSCNDGYAVVGDARIRCQEDGRWSGDAPLCRLGDPCSPNPCPSGLQCVATIDSHRCEDPDARDRDVGWDVVFLVDSSGSLDRPDFASAKTIIQNIVSRRQDPQGNTRYGLMQFSDITRKEFDLNDFSEKEEVLDAIRGIQQLGGGSFVGNAMDAARQDSFASTSGNRPGSPDALVLVTDGRSDDAMEFAAQSVRHENISIFAIGIGDNVDQGRLEMITDDPQKVLYVTGGQQSATAATNRLEQWFSGGTHCEDPGAPTNGSRRGTSFQGGDVDFSCDDGFTLNGVTRITCQADGTWTDDVPTCTAVGGAAGGGLGIPVAALAALLCLLGLLLLAGCIALCCSRHTSYAPAAAMAAPIEPKAKGSESQVAIIDFVGNP